MKRYRVERTIVEYIEVEADSAEEAEEIAFETDGLSWDTYDMTAEDVTVTEVKD